MKSELWKQPNTTNLKILHARFDLACSCSNGNAYYCPRRLAPGLAQLGIYTNKQVQFWSIPNDGMHMAVNMEPSMQNIFRLIPFHVQRRMFKMYWIIVRISKKSVKVHVQIFKTELIEINAI
jgi:hypothetical protein